MLKSHDLRYRLSKSSDDVIVRTAVDQKQLLDTLNKLHEGLSQTEEADPSTVELLRTVTADIERLLQHGSTQNDEANDDSGPIAKGLRELLVKFEGDHPRLAAMIERITDGLASLGI